jgi:hypothetical protein
VLGNVVEKKKGRKINRRPHTLQTATSVRPRRARDEVGSWEMDMMEEEVEVNHGDAEGVDANVRRQGVEQ